MSKRKHRSRNQRRRRKKKIILLCLEVFALLALAAGLFLFKKLDKIKLGGGEEIGQIEVNDEVFSNKYLKGYTNIALFGVDSREGDVKSGNSDTLIIASINNDTKEVRMVSLYRDTYLDVGGGNYTKSNAAYNQGGPKQSLSMINTNLDLNIQNFVSVDFKALATVIDCVGGVDIDLSYEEIEHLNNYCVETAEVTGLDYKKIKLPERPKDISEIVGNYHLNGVQATAYCRIRKTAGWDMKRAERQRKIIALIVEKVKKSDLGTLNKVLDKVFPLIYTNFSKTDLIKLGTGIFSYKLGENTGFPNLSMMGEEVVAAIGLDCVVPTTLEVNVRLLHDFLFGEGSYDMSETVLERSRYIENQTGFGSAYVPDEYKHLDTAEGGFDEPSEGDTDDSSYDDSEDYNIDSEDYSSDSEDYGSDSEDSGYEEEEY